MSKFERKYAFWFEDGSTYMFGGEISTICSDHYIIKPRVEGYDNIVVKDLFIIVPYAEGVKMQKSLDKSQRYNLGVVNNTTSLFSIR